MTKITRERLKDGRLRGAVGRRILAALVRRPGEVVCPESLRDEAWPNGAPLHWRVNLPAQAKQVNRLLGRQVIEQLGNQARLIGFRLVSANLPKDDLTQVRAARRPRFGWTDAEDRVLREQAGALPLSDLTAAVNAANGHDHTVKSVSARICTLGLSQRVRGYSVHSLAPVFGVHQDTVLHWIRAGLLEAAKREPDRQATRRLRQGWWLITEEAVERFVRACPWEYDWRAMQRGHPLTILARSVQQRAVYLTIDQAARHARVHQSTVMRWLSAERLPGARRVTSRYSAERSSWRIPLDSLPQAGGAR